MRPKARKMAQHGDPPGWLEEESDPAGCGFVSDGRSMHAACPDRPHRLPQCGADLLLNAHKTLS